MTKSLFSAFALLFLMAILFTGQSCKKDDTVTPGDTLPPTQSITFIVEIDTLFANGALCGLATTSSDRDNGVFLRSGTTGSTGRLKLDNLQPYTYYYNVSYTHQGTVLTRKGTIELDSLERHTENVQF